MMTEPDPDTGLSNCLSNGLVDELLLSANGATQIMTEEELTAALIEIYYLRVDLGLENPIVLDLPFYPELLSCTEMTREPRIEFVETLDDATFSGLDLLNMGPLLENIELWLV